MANKTTIIGGVLLALGLLLPIGCKTYGDFCEARMDCEVGNDADVDACLVEIETDEERADIYGCSEWFDDYIACREAQSTCEAGNHYSTGNRCEREDEHYQACLRDGLDLY
ncbi:MAG: hypothetical protein IT373_08860 [Polyangiaceae bacterium]|nr:hypothetical protein [Polyangiaceae bacterium]